jgi:hypothetical protein
MTTMPPRPAPGARPWGAAPRVPDAPIFEALARGWVRAGRSVPGQHDHEWAELTGRCPWPADGHRDALGPYLTGLSGRPQAVLYATRPYPAVPGGPLGRPFSTGERPGPGV